MDARQQVANIIKEAIESSGRKQKDIGNAIDRSESSVSRYGTGESVPKKFIIKRLATEKIISPVQAAKLIELIDEIKDDEAESAEPTPVQALRGRFQALEAQNEALESRLAALQKAFDNHTHT